jgi:hypothetical protein
MNLSKKLTVGLLVAGTMTGAGLSVAGPVDAATSTSATSTSTTVPQVTYPRWVALGTYSTDGACAIAGRALLADESNVGDWKCIGASGGWRLWVLLTAP